MKNLKIKQFSVRSIIFSGLLAAAFLAVGSSAAQAHNDADCETKQCRKQLAAARAATAKYHDVNNALADGFINTRQCVQHPFLGAMGIHFVNPARIGNPGVDAAEPEILLYLSDEDGEMRLVGLEYVVPAPLSPIAPVLFGQEFHFDAPRNQWALHVWAWRNNPNGMFADFNPKLSCPQT